MNTSPSDHFLKNGCIYKNQKGVMKMRMTVIIDDSLQVYEIFNISDAKNGCLLATMIPHGEPIVIRNVYDTENVIYKITLHGWVDLSMYPAHYLTDTVENTEDEATDDEATDDDDMEQEINLHDLER